jgi:hypothetical protein
MVFALNIIIEIYLIRFNYQFYTFKKSMTKLYF